MIVSTGIKSSIVIGQNSTAFEFERSENLLHRKLLNNLILTSLIDDEAETLASE